MKIDVSELMSQGMNAQQAFEKAFDMCRANPVLILGSPVVNYVASGVVYAPSGVYKLTDRLVIPLHVHLEGDGQTSVLAFENGGLETPRQHSDPDPEGHVTATQFYSASVIRDISLVNTGAENAHAGLDMSGGEGVYVERVSSAGWRNHYLLDQVALVSIEQCYLGGGDSNEHENGIVFPDPPRAPMNSGGAAQCNFVSRCVFNLRGNPIVAKVDMMCVVDRGYVNGGGPMIFSGRRVSVRDCTFEAIQGEECILIDAPGETGASSLEVSGCVFSANIAAIRFNTRVVVGFTFNGNFALTTSGPAGPGGQNARFVIENQARQLQGPLIILGNTGWNDARMVANAGLGDVMLYASSAHTGEDGDLNRIGI